MNIERETLRDIAVSVGAVGLFVALLYWVGTNYSNDGLSETGAIAVVAVIVFFVLLMTGIGVWMAYQE
ncbi:hypothetical protein NGM10_10360 [Halorussus salilacus]|uniref:DUF7472 family protein n=1 Tax=Halorussus salilacus TaxID=2953750 RepID=UPI0020A0E6F9|nr:hypothetical protein [Halorussus salilacus]USZ67132.1 hypothetical protein NGM10_10360 [Halorussus salilacus]